MKNISKIMKTKKNNSMNFKMQHLFHLFRMQVIADKIQISFRIAKMISKIVLILRTLRNQIKNSKLIKIG